MKPLFDNLTDFERTNFMRRLLLIFALVTAFATNAVAQYKQTHYEFSHEEALQLVNQLIGAIEPDKPENAYMPPLLRDKIRWVYRQYEKKHLTINYVASYDRNRDGSDNKGTFMRSQRANGGKAALIEIFALRLIVYVRIQKGVLSGYNDEIKDLFAIALAHKAVHLEVAGPAKENLQEEERTWRKIDLGVIRPMRAAGRKVEADFIEADDLLRRCHDRPVCPGFTRFISMRTF
jgi:hypothetical protein